MKNEVPYASVSYMLCPEIAGNAGATSAQAQQTIETFIKETGAKVAPLTRKIEVTADGLWRVLLDQLNTKVIYECTPQKGLKLICNLYGEGGRRYDVASPEAFDGRLLYDLYIKNSFALNGYFSSKVSGYIQAKPDSPELEKVESGTRNSECGTTSNKR